MSIHKRLEEAGVGDLAHREMKGEKFDPRKELEKRKGKLWHELMKRRKEDPYGMTTIYKESK